MGVEELSQGFLPEELLKSSEDVAKRALIMTNESNYISPPCLLERLYNKISYIFNQTS